MPFEFIQIPANGQDGFGGLTTRLLQFDEDLPQRQKWNHGFHESARMGAPRFACSLSYQLQASESPPTGS